MAKKAPKDPKELTREIDATLRVRSIRELEALKEQLAPRFGEFTLLAGLFTFTLGLILTLVFALPQEKEVVYYIWLLWSVGYLMASVVCIEFLIRKFRVVRRVSEQMLKRIERLEKRQISLQKQLEASLSSSEEVKES